MRQLVTIAMFVIFAAVLAGVVLMILAVPPWVWSAAILIGAVGVGGFVVLSGVALYEVAHGWSVEHRSRGQALVATANARAMHGEPQRIVNMAFLLQHPDNGDIVQVPISEDAGRMIERYGALGYAPMWTHPERPRSSRPAT